MDALLELLKLLSLNPVLDSDLSDVDDGSKRCDLGTKILKYLMMLNIKELLLVRILKRNYTIFFMRIVIWRISTIMT